MGNDSSQAVKYGERIENNLSIEWLSKLLDLPKSAETFVPAGRDGHVSCSIGKKLYVFGGVVKTGHTEGEESGQMLVFNLESGKWEEVVANGDKPAARSMATMCAVNNKLYLFGGLSHTSGWNQDLYCFNTDTSTWEKLSTLGQSPSPRDKLASAAKGSSIFFFGGFGPKCNEEEVGNVQETEIIGDIDDEEEEMQEEQDGAEFGWFNDLHVYNTETNTWSCPNENNPGVPSPRAAHAMCVVNNLLIIFGGRDQKARQNDLYIYNTDTNLWETLKVKGRQPEPRSFHTATSVGHRVVVLGGRSSDNQHFNDFHIYDTSTQEWLQPSVLGTTPCRRGSHSVSVVDDQLILFGGSGKFDINTMQCQEYYNDVFMVNTGDILSGRAVFDVLEENQENIPSSANTDSPSKPAGKNVTDTNNSGIQAVNIS